MPHAVNHRFCQKTTQNGTLIFKNKFHILIIVMVSVAQLVEHQTVALRVVGSIPTTHPIKNMVNVKSTCQSI